MVYSGLFSLKIEIQRSPKILLFDLEEVVSNILVITSQRLENKNTFWGSSLFPRNNAGIICNNLPP